MEKRRDCSTAQQRTNYANRLKDDSPADTGSSWDSLYALWFSLRARLWSRPSFLSDLRRVVYVDVGFGILIEWRYDSTSSA